MMLLQKEESWMAVAALDSHSSQRHVGTAVVQSLTLTDKDAVDDMGNISDDDPEEMKSTMLE